MGRILVHKRRPLTKSEQPAFFSNYLGISKGASRSLSYTYISFLEFHLHKTNLGEILKNTWSDRRSKNEYDLTCLYSD